MKFNAFVIYIAFIFENAYPNDYTQLEMRDYQEINYPMLWGGHLVRPCLRAGETPTPQEKLNVFYLEIPDKPSIISGKMITDRSTNTKGDRTLKLLICRSTKR
ncbi:MAG: hypothetical protein V7L01_03630 [Nostoc sp.]|uniref:hypothetical protein n=1 Tax=Nostoc sp. TaxID=1180 RepID=UPI002FF4DEA2